MGIAKMRLMLWALASTWFCNAFMVAVCSRMDSVFSLMACIREECSAACFWRDFSSSCSKFFIISLKAFAMSCMADAAGSTCLGGGMILFWRGLGRLIVATAAYVGRLLSLSSLSLGTSLTNGFVLSECPLASPRSTPVSVLWPITATSYLKRGQSVEDA